MNRNASNQLFNCLVQGTVIGRADSGHTNTGRAFAKFRISHRTGYYHNGIWMATKPMEFQVTCWNEQQVLLARSLTSGTEVVVTVKNFFPYLGDSDEPVINITPADIVVLGSKPAAPAPRGQRSGDLVVSPHGEKIAADAWPDTVTDLDLVHHG